MLPDREIIELMREVAKTEILPRFRNLAVAEVRHKGRDTDLVTVADEAAERRLSEALVRLVPGSRVVGEEAAYADPAILATLDLPGLVWVIDPVDGTGNFVNGNPCFGMILALCIDGETAAGWIYDPVNDVLARARKGEGAHLESRSAPASLLRLTPPSGVSLTGSLTGRIARGLKQKVGISPDHRVGKVRRIGSTAREYIDLARGRLHFAQYTRLKPWDHAAGVLIHQECGGFSRIRRTRSLYHPGGGISEETLLLTPDEASWIELDGLLDC
jgi:fructose-1,6-bisphosphatase/inositol monophosphatase family enzyme